MKSYTTLKLGDLAKDRITGFQGVIVGRTDWINGCTRMALQGTKLDKDGIPSDVVTFDVEQLVLVKADVHPPASQGGGPMPDAKRR